MLNPRYDMAAAEVVPIPTGEALLPANADFASKVNRVDFEFAHGLAQHPLFEPRALGALASRIPKFQDFVYWQNGRIELNDKWDHNPARRLTLEETIEGIAENDSLVILKHAEQDPVYGPLLTEILQRMYSYMSPQMQSDIVLGESLIFLNSPRRKTAYHIDLESSFLLQVRGLKHVRVHSCSDRTLMPHEELENHCSGNNNGAIYKPEREADSHYYHLTAGRGVHFPSTAPHWVENGDELSISININYDHRSVHHTLQPVYRVNRVLRRLGLSPTPPGQSPLLDDVKRRLRVGADALQARLRRAPPGAREARVYPQWRPKR